MILLITILNANHSLYILLITHNVVCFINESLVQHNVHWSHFACYVGLVIDSLVTALHPEEMLFDEVILNKVI